MSSFPLAYRSSKGCFLPYRSLFLQDAMTMKKVSVIIKGKVQGVFFRASAREVALQMGITGIVRNEPDGSVYIEAEGDEEQLKKYIAWCRKGPPRAFVEDVQVTEGPIVHFTSFTIDR